MFSPEEIDLLLQGLDSIEKTAIAADMMGDLLIASMSRSEEQAEELKRNRIKREQAREAQVREQRMKINVLKGKLAQIALGIESDAPFGQVSTIS